MLQSQKHIETITERLTILRMLISSKAKLGLTDLNVYCENFMAGLLNRVYGHNLKNLNEGAANYPGLDLGDREAGLAYQITSTKTSEKINHTLRQCLDKAHYKTFSEIYVFILTEKQKTYSVDVIAEPHFSFNPARHIQDFDDLFRSICNLPPEKLDDLELFIEKELPDCIDRLDTLLEKIFISKLPTYSGDLIGREAELQLMDTAWEDGQCNLLVFKAAGGVGKTALTGHWLFNHLQPRNYEGAKWIYAWSFYSQGASEGAQTSAEPFMIDALKFFDVKEEDIPKAAYDKARLLATKIAAKRGLLIIDGLEPLQYPAHETGPKEKRTGLEGEMKDKAMAVLLRQLAANNQGLCLVSTRLELKDVQERPPFVQFCNLNNLSDTDGATMLRQKGVTGKDAELIQTARDVKGHALTLKLLANLLVGYHDGDIRQKDRIQHLTDDREAGGHAWRVMDSYMNGGYLNEAEKSLLCLLGLFDRPATIKVLDALVAGNAAPEITDALNGLPRNGWIDIVKHLEGLGLLILNEYEKRPVGMMLRSLKGLEQYESLDAHPLVREYFEQHLQQEKPAAWQQANLFLYEYYQQQCVKELPDTLEEMEPLFLAVAYGCRAGKEQEVLDEIYWKRIKRTDVDYSLKQLGAFASELTAISYFFQSHWDTVSDNLDDHGKAVVLSWVGYILRATGRLEEAASAMYESLKMGVMQEKWANAAIRADNISALFMLAGNVERGVTYGRDAVEYADKSADKLHRASKRGGYASSLHQSGKENEALEVFIKAEQFQQEAQPHYFFLYSTQGFNYCELLIDLGRFRQATERVSTLERWDMRVKSGKFHFALAKLHYAMTCIRSIEQEGLLYGDKIGSAGDSINEGVSAIRELTRLDYLPKFLLIRASFFRLVNAFLPAQADLQEAFDIAEYGGMKLYYVDYHLENMRLHLAMGGATNIALAATHRATARQLIAETGYNRRLKEVDEGWE